MGTSGGKLDVSSRINLNFVNKYLLFALSGSISLNYLSIFYNISCYNSLVLLTFVSRSSSRFTYIYIEVRNNRQNTKSL
jgi:hypothetical protein